MIKKVVITNHNGESLEINLDDVEAASGLFITNIEGLGPVKANINMTDLATRDGARFNSARAEKRNIVINLRYIGPNAEEARLTTYKYFPLKQQVTFYVETENRKAEIEGYIESNTPVIFSESSGSQISILCEDAFFKDAGDYGTQEIPFSNIVAEFEFPFEEVAEETPGIEFSSVEIKSERLITYNGETEIGVVMKLFAYGHFVDPVIYNIRTLESMKIYTAKIESIIGSQIDAGDEIEISTIKNNKYIHFIRNGVRTNILNAIDKDADWFTLLPGDNIFSYSADEGELNISFVITVQVLFSGV